MSDEQMTCPESGETFTPCEMRVGWRRVVCGAPSCGQVKTPAGPVITICTDCRRAFGYRLNELMPLPAIRYACEHCDGTGMEPL